MTVGRRMRALTGQMEGVGRQLREANVTGDWSQFDLRDQLVVVDSEDELGDMAVAYNRLLEELHSSHTIEAAVGDVFEALSSHLEIATLAQAALEQIVSHVDAESGVIFIIVDGDAEDRCVQRDGRRRAALRIAGARLRCRATQGEQSDATQPCAPGPLAIDSAESPGIDPDGARRATAAS